MSSLFMCTLNLSRWALFEQERIFTIFLFKYASAIDDIPPTARRKCLIHIRLRPGSSLLFWCYSKFETNETLSFIGKITYKASIMSLSKRHLEPDKTLNSSLNPKTY